MKYCPYCSLELPFVPKMCACCGAQLQPDFCFCSECGLEVGKPKETTPQPDPPKEEIKPVTKKAPAKKKKKQRYQIQSKGKIVKKTVLLGWKQVEWVDRVVKIDNSSRSKVVRSALEAMMSRRSNCDPIITVGVHDGNYNICYQIDEEIYETIVIDAKKKGVSTSSFIRGMVQLAVDASNGVLR